MRVSCCVIIYNHFPLFLLFPFPRQNSNKSFFREWINNPDVRFLYNSDYRMQCRQKTWSGFKCGNLLKKFFWGKMYVPGKHIIDPAPKTKKKKEKISSIVLCVQFCVCGKMGFKIWHHSKAASALLREKCPNWRNLARGSAPVQKQILIFLKNSKPTKMQSSQTCIFWPKPTPPPTFTRAGTY